MGHAYLSASGGDRAAACPPAFALEQGPREESDDAARGTAIHAYLESLQDTPRDAALASVPDAVRDTCAGISLDDVPRGAAEIAYVWDAETDTAIRLGKIEHRGYRAALGRELRATEIPCTIDLVIENGPTWEACDWKTGYETVPNPATSMQLALAALCIARVHGPECIEVSVRRVGMDGQIYLTAAEMDAFALEDAAERWRSVLRAVEDARDEVAAGRTPKTTPGSHCKWCSAKAACPQFDGVARELLAPGSNWLERARTAIATDDAAAAELWLKVQRAREMLATIQGLLEARAAERPFALPDGATVREVDMKRDAVRSGEIVRAVLAELYGTATADAAIAIEVTSTKGAIEKAVGAYAKANGAKAAPEVRRALTVLREHGAIVTNSWKSVEAVAPERGKSSAA